MAEQQDESMQRGDDTEGGPTGEETADGAFVFDSVAVFYDEYLAQILCRPVGAGTLAWCADWWLHPEAIVRITALWRAFEYLRTDASLGMSNWWLHHADPHLGVLMDPRTGPFALCTGPLGHSGDIGPLPSNPSPPDMWDDPAFSVNASQHDESDQAERGKEAAGAGGAGGV
ncbi:DUF4913 domain-containing protein [Streptomyces sp. NPDC005752]|uniref:DUF4913 domain-containing protein n=1 Tax=Streptomyces sp. NPDC005752 TaxID=3157065 RepID=UPI0033D3EC45